MAAGLALVTGVVMLTVELSLGGGAGCQSGLLTHRFDEPDPGIELVAEEVFVPHGALLFLVRVLGGPDMSKHAKKRWRMDF